MENPNKWVKDKYSGSHPLYIIDAENKKATIVFAASSKLKAEGINPEQGATEGVVLYKDERRITILEKSGTAFYLHSIFPKQLVLVVSRHYSGTAVQGVGTYKATCKQLR